MGEGRKIHFIFLLKFNPPWHLFGSRAPDLTVGVGWGESRVGKKEGRGGREKENGNVNKKVIITKKELFFVLAKQSTH